MQTPPHRGRASWCTHMRIDAARARPEYASLVKPFNALAGGLRFACFELRGQRMSLCTIAHSNFKSSELRGDAASPCVELVLHAKLAHTLLAVVHGCLKDGAVRPIDRECVVSYVSLIELIHQHCDYPLGSAALSLCAIDRPSIEQLCEVLECILADNALAVDTFGVGAHLSDHANTSLGRALYCPADAGESAAAASSER